MRAGGCRREAGWSGGEECVGLARSASASGACRPGTATTDTPARAVASQNQGGKISNKPCFGPRKAAMTSGCAASYRRLNRGIREKIIGHGWSAIRFGLAGSRRVDLRRTGTLLHQPARQHGGGIFLEPLVEQGVDLLSKVGGVAQPRQFITLQTIARSGKQKFPGRLRLVARHGCFSSGDSSRRVTLFTPRKYFVSSSC
jgi:hypothetical protein